MKGGARILFAYFFFLLVSGGIHAAVIWGIPWYRHKKAVSTKVQVRATVVTPARPEAESPEMIQQPRPVPVEEPPKYKETEKEKKKDPDPREEAKPEPKEKLKPKEEAKPKPKPEPKEKPKPKEEVKPEPKPKPKAAPRKIVRIETRPAPKEVQKPAPEKKAEPLPKPEPKKKSSEIRTSREYRDYLVREMPPVGSRFEYVPKIAFRENTAGENLEIIRYFRMVVIAHPKGAKKWPYYIYIDPAQDVYSVEDRKESEEYLRHFSNRVIYRAGSPYFQVLRVKAARVKGVSPDSLWIAQLMNPTTAQYVAWKQHEAARSLGIEARSVRHCEASFVKSRIGAWIVRIDAVRLKDGRVLPVRDGEWLKLEGGAR